MNSLLTSSTGIPFPEIDPVLIAIGPFAIRWYALAYVAGILLGWYYIDWLRKKRPQSMPQAAYDNAVIWTILGILLGGRIGYVLFYNLGYYIEHPGEILAVWRGGMSFHGGLIGLLLSMWLMTRHYKIPFLPVMDLVACAAPIGLFFGRIANFINAELYGRPTDVAWGVIFPHSDGLARHPSQVYEAGLEGLLLFLILFFMARKTDALNQPGRLGGLSLIGYSWARAFVELYREPDAQIGYLFGYMTMGQLLSLPMLIFGVILFKKRKPLATTSVIHKRSNKPVTPSK